MASLADAEEVLRSTNAKANFQRLTRLLMCGGLRLLRETFDSIHSPADLPVKLSDPAIEVQLRGARLTRPEWNCLYPSTGVYGKSTDFDITLIFKLLRKICGLTPPPGPRGWDDLPNSSDHSFVADLVRIKYYRNRVYGHKNTMEISDLEFDDLWRKISEALIRIAASISRGKRDEWKKSIDDFLVNPLTPEEERYVEELDTWYKQDMDVKIEVEQLKEEVKNLAKDIKEGVAKQFHRPVAIFVVNTVGSITQSGVPIVLNHPSARSQIPPTGDSLGTCTVAIPQREEAESISDSEELQLNPLEPINEIHIWSVILSFKKSFELFVKYLGCKLNVFVRSHDVGSLLITVECSSLQVLEGLWDDYRSGHLNKIAQEILVTAEVLKKLGLDEVKLNTFISEEEYEKGKQIFFNDSSAAKSVGSKTHTINGTQVEESLNPFTRETHSQEKSAYQTCVVIIRGLSQNTTKDALQNYFENTRRSGGGDVEEVDFNGDWARIKFESPEVANRVVARDKHSLNGATLDVSFEMPESDAEKGKTIQVAGLAPITTEDSIVNYFENKRRSGGGEVERVDLLGDTGLAYVTFKDANVANSVLQQSNHTLDGVTLSVTACNNPDDLHGREEEQESRVIEVTGLSETTTKDSITLFFENTRRTGGGEVEHVDFAPDQGKAVVTFANAESVRGVVRKGILTFDNAQLKVTIKQPVKKPPTDTTRLVIKGLSDKTTSDGLQCYMEVVSGGEVLSIEFGKEGCALVTFKENYDFQTITQKIAKRQLEGKQLSIEKVPVCNCVQVTGLNRENTTKDAVLYYFDNSKNGGGVTNVELNIKEGWAVVYFEDPQVVNTVLSKNHSLNGAQLGVKPHTPFLGKPVSEADEEEVELSKIASVDPQIMLFIFERHKADYTEMQNAHGVNIIWEEGASSITFTTLDKASTDRNKFDTACESIASFLGAFLTATTQVMPEAWQTVLNYLNENDSSVKEKVKFQYSAQQHAITLIGKKKDVEGLVNELQVLNKKIERKMTLEASKTTSYIENIPRIRLKFLKDLDFDKELAAQHEETQVSVLIDKGKVQICAPKDTVHRVSAAVWEAVANIRDLKLEISQNAVEILRSRTCQAFMKDQFTANNLQAALAFDSENEEIVFVVGMKTEVAEKASELVKRLIVEECLDLNDDQVQLDRSEKWRKLRYELTEKRILSLSFDRSNKQIRLVGTKEDVLFALKAVERFLKDNTIVSTVVELPRGCQRYLAKYRVQEIRQIEDELKEHLTRVKGMEGEDDDLVVSGTPEGVNKGTHLIEDLASKVSTRKVFLNKPGMRKVLDRSKGKKLLSLLENEHKCVIEHFVPRRDASSKKLGEEEEEANKKKESLCNFLTPEGKNILVYKDNICERDVEVIVNAANSNLHHVGGVAKAIAEAAGEAIKDECESYIIDKGPVLEGQVVVTSAGKLPFKKVIHAVGPQWRKEATREKALGKTPREERLLRYAVTNALKAAKSFKSIAIPAISTGIFGFPRELCAQIMIDSALAFCQETPGCRLSEIQFTSIDNDVVKAFVKQMDSRFLEDPNYESSSDTKGKIKATKGRGRKKSVPSSPLVTVSADIPNVITTAKGLNLVLISGDMSKEKVDVIVNTTSSDLDLTRNASAKALSAAAGPMLQQECKAIGKVNNGDIVVTSGANLKCKHVFHTSCPGWNQKSGEQALRDIVKKCLDEAQKRELVSIAIPAIGTGNLGYPRDRVAAASFDEVLSFGKSNPNSTLKEVHLVVYDKDLASVQAFQAELQKKKGSKPGTKPPPPTAHSGNKKRRKSLGMAAKKADSGDSSAEEDSFERLDEELDPLKPEFTIGSVTVQIQTGDITEEVTDAIATLSNEELDVALGGGTGKAILTAGGGKIQDECSALGRQSPGSIAVTGAGKLQVRKIYHMVPDYGMSMTSIKDCIFKCLQKANLHGLTSISFPAVGTGNVQKGAKEAAEAMLAAISKFAQEQPTSLAFIRIVIYQPHMLQVFRSAMEACISSGESKLGFMWKIAGWFGYGKSGSAIPYTTSAKTKLKEKGHSYLEIFADTKKDIDHVVKEIEKDVAEQFKQKVIERDTISKLSKQQKKKIKDLEVKHDAVVTIEEAVGRISIRGDAEDVLEVATTIHEILNQQIEEEHTRGVGELVSKNTQWFYAADDGNLEPYDTSINLQIEKAFGDGKDSVLVLIDDARFEIVFKDMKETCLDDGEETRVVRKELGKGIPLPVEWDLQPKDSSGKEKEAHLVPLSPVSHAHEYKKVEDEIRKTSNITILKVERVQSPALYRVYMVRKDQMEQKKGSNEKILFHGTAETSCKSINKFGFNRSYCGKNAVVYGNGVYFARDASYSTQTTYSPPDGAGNRYMYLARVLAGEYTKGRQGMITPPPKGSDATDTYDTVVDNPGSPSIFVVFYDNQCYPDYLITFK